MKKILLGLVALIILVVGALVVLVFAVDPNFKVEREIEINKPRAEVFSYVKELKNQAEWGPWIKRDPNIKLTDTGTDGEVGYVSKWDSASEEVGTGEQEIVKIVDGEQIDTKLRFKKPFESEADAFLILSDSGSDKTKVKWGFNGSMPRPMNLMLLFMDMDKEVGKDFDEGLKNLKEILEKKS
jgi:uncharacterized protein YndB with AHSA1/START domain